MTARGTVIAEAWTKRRGRTTCFAEGRLVNSEGKVLANASSTLMLAERSPVEKAVQAALQ